MGELNGCTADTVRCPSARDYTQTTNDCCVAHIDGILRDLHTVFEEAGVRYWIDYGTLIGQLWCKGFIPNDKDGDLGAFMTDWDKAQTAFSKLRDLYDVSVNHNRHSAKIRVSRKNHTNVDVFFWWLRKEDDILYRRRYARVDRYKGKSFPVEWIGERQIVPWRDLELWAPTEADTLAKWRYGDGWTVPLLANNDGKVRGEYERDNNPRKKRIVTSGGNLRKYG